MIAKNPSHGAFANAVGSKVRTVLVKLAPAAMAMLWALPAVLAPGCSERVAGGGSETEYFTLTGEATLPSGAAAAGARVSIRPADYLSGEDAALNGSVRDTVLDAMGTFQLKGLPDGTYSVEIHLGDSLGCVVTVARSPAQQATLTGRLEPMGRLLAAVAGPDSGVAYILRVRGLERSAAANPQGIMQVSLPPGTFTGHFSSSLAGSPAQEFSRLVIPAGGDTALPRMPAPDFRPAPPVPVLYDCNIGFAADDAGGLAVLHALADKGEARIIATGTSQPSRQSAAVLDVINTYYGRPDIPVGTWKKQVPTEKVGYDSLVAADFPQNLPAWDDLTEAAEVYRSALADLADGRAVLVVSGGVQNAWALMRLDRDLVARKVKELVIMGGQYPSGKEFNFGIAADLDTFPNLPAEVARDWPTPITFHGHETAFSIRTGACLGNTPVLNPVRRIYELVEGGAGKPSVSSDLSPALYGIRGLGTIYDKVSTGSNTIAADGSNQWVGSPDRDQSYLVLKAAPATLGAELDALLCREPGN